MSCFLACEEVVSDTVMFMRENGMEGDPWLLGMSLWMLNMVAVNDRYPDQLGFREILSYKFTETRSCSIQRFKNAACLFYQCNEENTSDHWLIKKLESFLKNNENLWDDERIKTCKWGEAEKV